MTLVRKVLYDSSEWPSPRRLLTFLRFFQQNKTSLSSPTGHSPHNVSTSRGKAGSKYTQSAAKMMSGLEGNEGGGVVPQSSSETCTGGEAVVGKFRRTFSFMRGNNGL